VSRNFESFEIDPLTIRYKKPIGKQIMPGSERRRELRRRRKRKKQVALIKRRAEKAGANEKTVLAEKLRLMTPGATTLIKTLELEPGK